MAPKLSDFIQRWQLDRQIDDHLTSQTGMLAGQVRFTQTGPNDLDYAETGELRLATLAPMRAERRYLWTFDKEGVIVRFADGSAFHRFDLGESGRGTDHHCGDDLYRVHYDFRQWPRWRAVWTVTGPRKTYTSISDYAPSDIA